MGVIIIGIAFVSAALLLYIALARFSDIIYHQKNRSGNRNIHIIFDGSRKKR